MAEMHRRHVLIEAPIEDVWKVVSDPGTQPDWWPEVTDVRVDGPVDEGDEYTRVAKRFGFLDQVDNVWVVERMEHLKEAHFRCTVSGAYARFALTPAQEETFVEAEVGMLPPNLRWKMSQPVFRVTFGPWLRQLVDALPRSVERTKTQPRA